jgi:medium-chain acyl-[acyl-carrier-protein] hydrolase
MRENGQLSVVCISGVCSDARVFSMWIFDPRRLRIVPLQLPGHGELKSEPLVSDIRELVPILATRLEWLIERPFVIVGHSLGAVIAQHLVAHLDAAPELLVAIACAPAGSWRQLEDVHHLTRDQLFAKVVGDHATLPPELRTERGELTLRSDLSLLETTPALRRPLSCPILAIACRDDRLVPPESLSAWAVVTTGEFTLKLVDGDHSGAFHEPAASEIQLEILRRVGAY